MDEDCDVAGEEDEWLGGLLKGGQHPSLGQHHVQ